MVKCGGFSTELAAQQTGERMRSAIRLALCAMRVGWDVSDRPATFGFGRVVVDEAAKRGVELRSDHNGLHVYPEQAIVRFASGQVNAVVAFRGPDHSHRVRDSAATSLARGTRTRRHADRSDEGQWPVSRRAGGVGWRAAESRA